MATFAEELKAWRERNRLTQEQAADTLAVTVAAVQNWEQRRGLPALLGTVRALMEVREAALVIGEPSRREYLLGLWAGRGEVFQREPS